MAFGSGGEYVKYEQIVPIFIHLSVSPSGPVFFLVLTLLWGGVADSVVGFGVTAAVIAPLANGG